MEDAGAVRRLRVTGAIAVLTIALLTIASASFLAWRHYTAPSRTEVINLSGLRRGQSVAVLYRAERLTRFPREVSELDEAIAKLEKSQAGLMDLVPADQAFYERFITLAKRVAAHPSDVASVDALEAVGTQMYAIYYIRTIQYSQHASANSERSFRTTMAGSVVTLVVLALLYAFVMTPGVRVVGRTLRDLYRRDERIKALYGIASAPGETAAAQIDDALVLGAHALGMEYAFVSRVWNGIATIRYRVAPDDLLPVDSSIESLPIGAQILANQRAVAMDDLTIEPFATAIQSHGLPWKSCIGGRVLVDGVDYGVLAFLSNRVRKPGFEPSDRDFIDLMSALIGSALGRDLMQAQLREMAFHDSLTGLANRSLLEEHITRALAQAGRSGQLVAVHYLDLNRFKPVNDEYGHAAGDAVLREVARRFSAVVRGQDVVARVGGDEFVVLQTGATDPEQIRLLAQRLRDAMKERFALANGVSADVGVSVGTAIYPRDARDAAGLLRAADAAMYGEKTERRRAG